MTRISIEDLRAEADLSRDEQEELLGGANDQRGTYYIGVTSVGNEDSGSTHRANTVLILTTDPFRGASSGHW
jgi:hypothetical protein